MNQILDTLTKKLNASGIHPLRQLGRAVGVYSPTSKKKEELIEDILAIATNRADPVPLSRRGAPPKSEDYNAALLAEVERCRRYFSGLSVSETQEELPATATTVSSSHAEEREEVYSGLLEFDGTYWFLRTLKNGVLGGQSVFVHTNYVNRFRLRTGDFVVCNAQTPSGEEGLALSCVLSVNGVEPNNLRRVSFESLTACYPKTRVNLGGGAPSPVCRAIDLFAPLALGQRVLITAPPVAGKTTLLKHIAGAMLTNHPSLQLIIVLIGEPPEEITDFLRTSGGARLVCSPFERGDGNHVRAAALAIEHAKRIAEGGKHAVVLLDSLNRLVRSAKNLGPSLSDADALAEAKRFFGAARNTENGGSVTVIATCETNTGNSLDQALYADFIYASASQIALNSPSGEGEIFPEINLLASRSRRDESLLTPDEYRCASLVRSALSGGASSEQIMRLFSQTDSNAAFVAQCKNILEKLK